MEFLYIIIILSISLQNVATKAYNLKVGGETPYTYGAGNVFCAFLFFLFASGFKFDFKAEILPYAFGFALTYALAVLGTFLAIKYGSLSLTSLITSYSLIVPTFYGILFLGEGTGITLYLGIAALMVSLFLANYKKSEKKEGSDKEKSNLKWIVFVTLAFLGNGICSTVQMTQQKKFDGEYKNEMMIIALFAVFLIFLAIALVTERDKMKVAIKGGGVHMAVKGGLNGLTNLLVMFCAVATNASIMYPIISAGGIICTALISIMFYREKLTKMQYSGLILGIFAVVLLNLPV